MTRRLRHSQRQVLPPVADGDAIAPENMPDPFVNSGNSKVLTMTFLFPDTTRSAQLQVGEIDQKSDAVSPCTQNRSQMTSTKRFGSVVDAIS